MKKRARQRHVPYGAHREDYVPVLLRMRPGSVKRIPATKRTKLDKLQSLVNGRVNWTWGEGLVATHRDWEHNCLEVIRLR